MTVEMPDNLRWDIRNRLGLKSTTQIPLGEGILDGEVFPIAGCLNPDTVILDVAEDGKTRCLSGIAINTIHEPTDESSNIKLTPQLLESTESGNNKCLICFSQGICQLAFFTGRHKRKFDGNVNEELLNGGDFIYNG